VQKGEKESPVQAIETEISQGEPAAPVRTGHVRSHSALTDPSHRRSAAPEKKEKERLSDFLFGRPATMRDSKILGTIQQQ